MQNRVIFLALLALVSSRCIANDDTAPDPIRDVLDKAKATYSETIEKAKVDLRTAFDAQIQDTAKTGNLEHVKSLQSEKKAFDTDGKLPTSQPMKKAVADYQSMIDTAHKVLCTAYETAVSDYTKKLKIAKADAVNNDYDAFKKPTHAKSVAVATPEPASAKKPPFEYQFFSWKQGDAPVKMVSKDEDFCHLTEITGAFHGGGEQAHVDIKDDGYWYVWGTSQSGAGLWLKAVAAKVIFPVEASTTTKLINITNADNSK